MNPSGFPTGEPSPSPSKKELQLQGPRPPPLKISKESHKIKKPPLPPPADNQRHHAQPESSQQQRQPVIIYSVSPKVITVSPRDFMDVVQRLTGLPRDDEIPAGPGDVSPAARLASIEKTSPTDKERSSQNRDDDMTWMLGEGVEVGQFPGILTAEPGTLPPIHSDIFSPVWDPHSMSYLNDFWSPNSFMASPSGFLSATVVSPQPSPNLFSLFD